MSEQLALFYSYLHGIWQYRWSALVISWIVALLGWAVVYVLPNQYTSYTVMHIDTKSVMRPLLEGLSVDADIEQGIDIMTRRLMSRENLERIVMETDLSSRVTDGKSMYRVVKKLAEGLVLLPADEGQKKKGSDAVYALSFQGRSPELVYQIVDKGLETLIDSTLESGRTDTAAAQIFLDKQITEYEKRLSAAEQKLADFKRSNVDLMLDQTGGYYNRLQGEKDALETIRSDLRLAERRVLEMRKQLKGEAPILGGPQVVKLRNYREQLQNMLTQFTENHPDVQALRATIAETLAAKDVGSIRESGLGGDAAGYNPVYQQLKADIHRASVEVETMKIKLVEKKAAVERLKSSVDVIPEVEAKLAKLNRDYDITRDRYLSMVERRESARLAQEVGLTGSNVNFRIINPPVLATAPSGPNRLLLTALVFFAAIAAGLAWGFFKYKMQPTFISVEQLDDLIGLPVLGTVGLYLTEEHRKQRKIQLTKFLLVFSLLVLIFVVIEYNLSGISIADILAAMRSSAI